MAGRWSPPPVGQLPALRDVGAYLGYIVVIAGATIKLLHGKGGKMEGWPVDAEAALSYSVYYAQQHVNRYQAELRRNQHGEHDG